MKIGILSDTHSLPLPKQLINDFKKVDLIIHAGDFCDIDDLKVLETLGTVKAVFGNMDSPILRKKLPRREILRLGQYAVGIFHGEGSPQTVLNSALREFEKSGMDAVIFGHSHQPFQEIIDGTIYFNPGSPNDQITAPYCSYGIMDISDSEIKIKHVKVKDARG